MKYKILLSLLFVNALAGSSLVAFGNPGLTTCRVCGDTVAKEANACPHCGAPKPYEGETQTTWHKNGKKEREGKIRNGKKEGLWKSWWPSGQERSEVHYKNGHRDGLETTWHRNGRKESEHHYKNGKRDGPATWWYDNGMLHIEGYWENGKKDGVETTWDKNGRVMYKVLAKDGDLFFVK